MRCDMGRWAVLGLAAITACSISCPASAADRLDFRQPVVFDHDVDFDDAAALAAVAAQHLAGQIDLRAVTVINNGAGLPGKGYQHTRCLLDRLGLREVPVADATYDLPNAFPDWLRLAFDDLLDTAIGLCDAQPPSQSPKDLIADVLASAPGRVILIATGPVTNLAEGFTEVRRPTRLARGFRGTGRLRAGWLHRRPVRQFTVAARVRRLASH